MEVSPRCCPVITVLPLWEQPSLLDLVSRPGSSGESLWEGAANIKILEVELPKSGICSILVPLPRPHSGKGSCFAGIISTRSA